MFAYMFVMRMLIFSSIGPDYESQLINAAHKIIYLPNL